jgi:hypothetical protein
MEKGWIKLHRSILDWEWYQDQNTFRLFTYLLLTANHKKTKFQGKSIERGQLITGRIALSEKTGLSQQSIRTCLERLKSTSEITIQVTNKFSLVTLTNYDSYQSSDDESTSKVTSQLTNNQPATNQQSTTSKECKEDKNDKKVINTTLSSPTPDADEVFKFWCEVMKKHNVKFTDKRLKAVRARLKDGYSLDDIKQAITGCSLDAWSMGENDRGKPFNDLELICRTGDKLEDFRDSVNTPTLGKVLPLALRQVGKPIRRSAMEQMNDRSWMFD